jgi:hypothetical protein
VKQLYQQIKQKGQAFTPAPSALDVGVKEKDMVS